MDYERVTSATSARDAVRLLTNDAFVSDFAAQIPVTLIDTTVREDGSGIHHVMTCEFETGSLELPKPFRSVLPGHIRLVWEQTWTFPGVDGAFAVLLITTHGKPGSRTEGHVRIACAPGGATYTFNGKTSVSVPLLGKRIASEIDEKLVTAVLDDQLDVLERHLTA